MADLPLLRADCASCVGLCCVATTLIRSSDFAFDKPAGEPCRHLGADFGCTIHADLRGHGMPGCTTYDCFGAGQRVAQETFAGTSWREDPGTAAQMFRVFGVVRALHELLWLLTEAAAQASSAPQRADLSDAVDRIGRLADGTPDRLDGLDVDEQRAAVLPLLRRAGELARAGSDGPRSDLAGADLLGSDLRGTDLRGASLRGSLLVGADLRGADLALADLTGADLRGADVRGTDLSRALFLSQQQANACRGDGGTLLPGALDRPGHWSPGTG